ncbi:MAG: hypothetical protein BMS9Abin29_0683 [Gemmatimonadota bacterium]|nr:MAG: hypothetical protein BMS9Abin29_0683 [Gemmatimonadota bacterium]
MDRKGLDDAGLKTPGTTPGDTDVALGVVRTLDRWYVEILEIAKSLGILGSGRESIRESEDSSGGRCIEFPDLADEGWPEFAIAIPSDAEFGYATSSVLYRGVTYQSALSPEELLVAFKGALTEVGAAYEAKDDRLDDYLRTTDLGGDVRIRLSPHKNGLTRIAIGQYRSGRRVEEALRTIAARFNLAGSDRTG